MLYKVLQGPVGGPGESKQSLPAHEINASINTHQSTGMHIPNQAIVLNWQVAGNIAATGLDSSRSSHVLIRESYSLVDSSEVIRLDSVSSMSVLW